MMLTERRKADREKMAAQLTEALTAHGATVERGEPFPWAPIDIRLKITAPGGATMGVDFERRSCQPDVFVQTWNTPEGVYLAPGEFREAEVNPYHLGKVNRVAHGFDALVNMLLEDVDSFAMGDGYASADHPRVVILEARRLKREAARAKWIAENPGKSIWDVAA